MTGWHPSLMTWDSLGFPRIILPLGGVKFFERKHFLFFYISSLEQSKNLGQEYLLLQNRKRRISHVDKRSVKQNL